MVSELVARLRDAEIGYRPHVVGKLFAEAADRIEALEAETVDKATAWDAIAEKNAEIARLRADCRMKDELLTAAVGDYNDAVQVLEEARALIEKPTKTWGEIDDFKMKIARIRGRSRTTEGENG